ncbi:hypothetical protein SAICODRAFT_9429 [Saitoella complicata NRRL Y-17804]|uniref:uncharacterized protein n=1 Tax=Saitoella complicata (strain BCRC 22490 / CBS 7301 / JCM 7358 / NBRC 10748 / NRRL Y-17804) TaxID=698492 RepID=UPI0008679010|nr:uncharacterized protein SAICODRAFT_9429 [Saitoella complicata NRRL Y-17804]ODQ51106.1 hypothetical protein SAICODRAFT_9429 [Saitoella complicata NRRL Y-17804]
MSMAAMNTETEMLRTHGRGGAGNIGNDADMIVEPVVIPVSLAGASGEAFSTGRGGIGNMGNVDESRSPPAPEPTQFMAQPPDAPAPDPDIASGGDGYGEHRHYDHEHHDHHSGSGSSATAAGQGLSTGRGGAGNVEPDHETIGEKVEEAVGIEDHDHPRRGSKHFTAGRTEHGELTQEEVDGGVETIKRRSSNAPKDLADAGVADKLKYKIKGLLHKE